MEKRDYAGKRFGRLLALYSVTEKSKRKWVCQCDCGGVTKVITYRLTSGSTISCGCRKKETSLMNCENNYLKKTHGMTGTPTWKTWSSMHDRVKQRYAGRKYYFEKGVIVCERWKSFELFLEDMGLRPEGMTLDRIDTNGHYEPKNCRWATNKTQQRNRTNTNYLQWNGQKVAAMEIADEIGVKKSAMQYYISVSRKLLEKYGGYPRPD